MSPPFPVLYEDNHLLVVDKPAGLLSQSDEPDGDEDVLSLGKRYIAEAYAKPGAVYLGLVHRLDRNVGGVMVLARTSKAAARLSKELREGRMEKRYQALAERPLPVNSLDRRSTPDAGVLEDYVRKDVRRRLAVAARAGEDGAKAARLSYRRLSAGLETTVGEDADDGVTRYDITLETGRFHQIRFQFGSRGAPLVGDSRYGGTRRLSADSVGIALHCTLIAVKHPTRDERMVFESAPRF